jgi:hypothetical protein
MVHTPGILAWAMNGYRHTKDQGNIRKIFTDGYAIPNDAAHALLNGDEPHQIEGTSVVFEAEVPDDWNPAG